MYRTEVAIETAKLFVPRDTADGSPAQMPVCLARPQGTPGVRRPGLLLIQEIFGVNQHIQDVVRRFAAAGYVVAAPDLFYRSGHWLSFGYDQFAEARPIVNRLTGDQVTGDLAATLDFLAAQPDVDPARLGTVGYCFGGRASLVAASRFGERVKAAAVYYGGGIVSDQPDAPVTRVGTIRCPVVGFFGGLDKHIPPEHAQRLEQALTQAGIPNAIYCYPYADHGFFCDARPSYNPRAAQDAWQRTLAFFAANLGPVPEVAWQTSTT
jgi:carboxymethylenebutenolidase